MIAPPRRTRWTKRVGVLCGGAFLFSTACAPALVKLPAGPGTPAPDAADALSQAMAVCRSVHTLTAEAGVSGNVNGERVRGRMTIGAAAPASARIEAVAPFGAPIFIFTAVDNDATLLLTRENRVLEHGPSDRVLEAIAGVPMDAAALRLALAGCASANADPSRARQLGPDWRVIPDGAADVYLHREGGQWRPIATKHHGAIEWRADYRAFQPSGLPRSIRFVSADRGRFDLQLDLSQVDTNTTLGPEVFRVQIPASAQRITLDELQHARPGIREN